MKKVLFGLLALGALSAVASENSSKVYETEIVASVSNRLDAYKTSSIVVDNIQEIEEKYNVKCMEGRIETGPMDNPLINDNKYIAICTGESNLKVQISSKFKSLKNLSNGRDLVQFKLKKVKIIHIVF